MARRTLDSVRRCASGEERDRPHLERALERTDDWLGRVDELLGDGAGERLEQARRLQSRAWDRFRGRDPQSALHLSLQSRRLALGILAEAESGTDRDRVRAMLGAAEDFLDEVAAMSDRGERRRIRDLLKRSREKLDEAGREVSAGDLNAAVVSIQAGLTLALEAADSQGPGGRR